MNDSPFLVQIEKDYLDRLIKKAAAWDMYSTASGSSGYLHEDLRLAVRLNDKPDKRSILPRAQTIIITNLPSPLSGEKLMNSFFAARGIRCYQIFGATGSVPYTTALVTFVTPACAKGYLSYVSKYGFFLGENLPPGYAVSDTQDEYIHSSPNSEFQCLYKLIPDAVVEPWNGPGEIGGGFIPGDEGGYCNVSHEIEMEAATRSLTITPGIAPKDLQMTLSYLAAQPKVESCRTTTLASTKELITTTRFSSVHDAIIVKTYLTSQKAFSGPGGRIVKYTKSPTDKPTENLGWHNILNLKPAETAAAGEPKNEHSEAEESITDDEEISFSLAKEALSPYISSSPSRICSTSLSHTSDDNSPASSEPEIQIAVEERKNGWHSHVSGVASYYAFQATPHPLDDLVSNNKFFRDETTPSAKGVRSKVDIGLTEIPDFIATGKALSRSPLTTGPPDLDSATFLSTFGNEILHSNFHDITVSGAQAQDTPYSEVFICQKLSPSKAEIMIADEPELTTERSALQPLNMNNVLVKSASGDTPAENLLQGTEFQLHDQELLESWMDDF